MVKLFMDPQATPCFFKPRIVPYELERLQKQGTIESIQFSSWAAPIILVLKADGKVSLAGGKSFTKLDMSQAYQQLLLDEESFFREQWTIYWQSGSLFRQQFDNTEPERRSTWPTRC
ncbi:hypothetical protein N1851_032760 [Merluccius polli]|uniref:Uncharacterized protein n=1 Tax=Merluccius polli TaxID=89951 RepID=A0AA47NNN9_MERPO|nr:hypothetical protein N1851_032760 [Merluccius polli]